MQGGLGGIILFRRNVDAGPRATLAFLADLISDAAEPILIAVDQEGGRVARLREEVISLPPMRALAARGDVALTRTAARVLGHQLRAIGFTMNMAPVLDVDTNPANPVIGDRAFGTTPEAVVEHALAFAAGLEDAGVASCGKHFPGHGDTDVDSHLALPTLSHGLERLDAVELAPFRAATGLPAWMSAHVLYEALDRDVPATLSRKVMQRVAREQLGYEGVIISDDLEMKAVADHFGIAPSAPMAIEAGCDMVLVCSDVDACFEAREALVHRAEERSEFRERLEEAATRGRALRQRFVPRPDLEALEAHLNSDEALRLTEVLATEVGSA